MSDDPLLEHDDPHGLAEALRDALRSAPPAPVDDAARSAEIARAIELAWQDGEPPEPDADGGEGRGDEADLPAAVLAGDAHEPTDVHSPDVHQILDEGPDLGGGVGQDDGPAHEPLDPGVW